MIAELGFTFAYSNNTYSGNYCKKY